MASSGKRDGSRAAPSPGLRGAAPDAAPDGLPRNTGNRPWANPEGTEPSLSATERRPAWNRRASDEQIVAAYRMTGSVWKTARRLGLVGQSVHERLRRLGYPMAHQEWSEDELAEAIS